LAKKKRSTKKKRPTKKSKPRMSLIATSVVLIILALAAFYIISLPGPQTTNQQQNTAQPPQPPQPPSTESCSRNAECFVVVCKNDPSVVGCVNAVHQDLFYKNCNPDVITNVKTPAYNYSQCACIQNYCQKIS
jgi:hypothetical protein